MNVEAYDADSLRKIVRILESENRLLKDKLKKANIPYDEINPFEEKIESAETYDLDQGERIVNPPYITEKMAIRFFSMFWGREDVYARRGKNGGYFPQCDNRWNDRLCPKQRKEKVFCEECENIKYNLISTSKVRNEMIADDVITCVARKQTPVILTRFKEHAKLLHDALKEKADHVFLLYGDKFYEKKYQDMETRLYRLYDEIEGVENSIEEVKNRLLNIRQQKISEENVYQFLLYFDKLYDKFTDLEKKEFLNSFVEQVDIYEQEQPDGRFLKHIKFRFPVYFGDREIQELCWNNESTVETVVLMSKQRNKDQLPGRDGEIRQLNSLRVYGQSEVRADGLCRS